MNNTDTAPIHPPKINWRIGTPLLPLGGRAYKSRDGSLYDRDFKGTLTRRGRKQEKAFRRQK